MTSDLETDREGCRLILELIAHIERRVRGMSLQDFIASKDEIDLTAYRLAVIGETTHRFTTDMKARHPEIAWRTIYAMRNYAVHAYLSLNAEKVWNAATFSLPPLKALCQAELGE